MAGAPVPPDAAVYDAIRNDPNYSGSWFSGWRNPFTWGNTDPLPAAAMPKFVAPSPSGTSTPWMGNTAPSSPDPGMAVNGSGTSTPWMGGPKPLPFNGSGTQTQWGGPDTSMMQDASPVISDYTLPSAPPKYSFLDAPGASDALVAFGAAMLKAPDFNTGLGDAALAVNKVARENRMPTEADYARAKQLGIISRLQKGESAKPARYNSMEMGYAPLGPNGEQVPVPAYLDPEKGYLYQMPDGSITTTPPPGFVRATDSSVGPSNQYRTKEQEELQAKVAAEVRSANLSVSNYRQMLSMVDTAGVGSDLRTRLASQVALLGGYNFDGINVSDQAVFNQKFKELNIDFAQKLQGQGQITEYERQIIAESLPQAGMNADAAKRVLNAMIAGAERKQEMWRKWNMSPGIRENYNNRYELFEADYLREADAAQRGNTSAGNAGSSPQSGSTSSGIKWSVDKP